MDEMNKMPEYGKTSKKSWKMTSKKKKIIIGSCTVAGAVIILLAATFVIGLLISPKKRVLSAINNTYGNGSKNIAEQYGKEGGTISLEAEVSGSGGSVGLFYDSTVNRDDKEKTVDFQMTSNGKSVVSGDLFEDKDNTYLKVDDVTTGYLEFDNDDFTDKFNNSALADILGNIQNYSIEKVSSDSNSGQVVGQVVQAIERLWRNADVQSAGKKQITIDNRKVTCTKYDVIISKEDVNSMLSEMSEAKQDEDGVVYNKEGSRPSSTLQLLQQLLANQTQQGQMQGQMPSQDSSGYGNMMPGQGGMFGGQGGQGGMFGGQGGQGNMMPGQGGMFGGQQGQMPGQDQTNGASQQQPQGQMDIKSLMETGVDEDVKLSVYIDGRNVRAFLLNVSLGNESGTDVTIASKNKGVDKVTYDSDWNVTVESAGLSASVYANISSNNEVKNFSPNGNILNAFDASESELKSFIGANTNAFNSKVQGILEALASLRGGSTPNMANGSPYSDQYGSYGGEDSDFYDFFSGNGSMSPFGGNDSSGQNGGFSMGPGMGGPGMGGPGMGMGPGMGGPGMGPGMNSGNGSNGDPFGYSFDDDSSETDED